jgi:hypothetical protein
MINYQGMLTDHAGTPFSGIYSITFKIYNAVSGGTKKWEETQSGVSVSNGLFNVILGSMNPIDTLSFAEQYWLDVTVGAEHTPTRLKFTSAGYAYRAWVADSAAVAGVGGGGGWVDDGTVVRLQTSTDKVGIGTTTPGLRLDIKSSGSADGIRITSSDDDDLFRARQNSDGSCGVLVYDSAGDPKVSIQGGTANSYFNAGNVGIGTTNPGAKLHVNGDLKVTDGAYYGNISSSSGSDGAPFPRWAYDSGWRAINPGSALSLFHNIGGNVDDYVVDLQFKDVDGSWGIHNVGMGRDQWHNIVEDRTAYSGAFWDLTDTYIYVHRYQDDVGADSIRVRIWVYK